MNIKTTENNIQKKFNQTDIILIGIISAWIWIINSNLRITGLYMDDLYMWSCYREQSFMQYILPIGSTRCRFVYWFVAWLEMGLIGSHINLIIPINLIILSATSAFIYFFARRLSRSRTISFIIGLTFATSRFSYYQNSQLLGLMEAMALILSIGILYYLYRYIHEDDNKMYILSLLLYFLVCFTHERYIVLLPLMVIALIFKKEKRIFNWLGTFLEFIIILVIRYIVIGTLSPAGTGGTTVADTFTIRDTIRSAISEVLYIFGINDGPEYLCGLPWEQMDKIYKILVLISILAIIFILSIFAITMAKRKSKEISSTFKDIILFIGFIAGCIASSSVTIRVEMRWIYAPFAAALLLVAYIYGYIDKGKEKKSSSISVVSICIMIYAICMIPTEIYLRTGYPHIYLFENQNRYNSLADVTYGTYGEDILGKQIVIVGNEYKMSDFTGRTFFKVYDKTKTGSKTTVTHVDSISDIGSIDDKIILMEDITHNRFIDITEALRRIESEQ